jgi:hypothetical protein
MRLSQVIQVWYDTNTYIDRRLRLCYWGQLRSYRYDTLAWRTSSSVIGGQFRLYRYHTLPRRTSETVLLGSDQIIQVSYAGTTYIVDCIIGVSAGHTGIIRWHDVWIVDCVIGVWSGHTNIIRWHDVYIVDCVICGQLRSYRYRTLPRRMHRWLCYLRQLRSYKYHMLPRRTSSTVLLGQLRSYRYYALAQRMHRWLSYWSQLRSYR